MAKVKMKNQLQLLLILMLLTACKVPVIKQQEHGQYYPIAQNAWIEIQQKARIEPDNARAYFQDGKWIHPSSLNLYEVNCELEVRDVVEKYQWINPGKFEIIRTQQDQSPIVFGPGKSTTLAWNQDQAPSDIKRFWKFTLQSKQQANVMHFICRGVQDSPYNATLPTSTEMQTAVGQHIKLHLF